MHVRLTRKFAEEIDGIDLSDRQVGDLMDLPARKAWLLIAEGWSVPERRCGSPTEVVIAFRRESDPGHLSRDERDCFRARGM